MTTPAPPGPAPVAPAVRPAGRSTNRELSFLDFCDRLLDLAGDAGLPLLERARFVGLFGESLDEFFQVRVAGLEDQVAAEVVSRSADGMRPAEQLEAISLRVAALVARHGEIVSGSVLPDLAAAGVELVDWHQLDVAETAALAEVFDRTIFPILTPLAVDPGHPFPYISNLSLNLVLRVVDPQTGTSRIARVKVPPLLPRFVRVAGRERFVPVEQIVIAHLGALFPAMTVSECHVFRVTRNADLSVERDDADDLLAAVELELQRRRFGQAVRLEAGSDMSHDLLDMLVAEVDVPEHGVSLVDTPLDLRALGSLEGLDRPDLAAPAWTPVTPTVLPGGTPAPPPDVAASGAVPGRPSKVPPAVRGPAGPADRSFFDVIGAGDVLVQHPYESFVTSVEAFLATAAADRDVVAIKQTLYRTSGDSAIVEALIRASRAGKQVTAVVELQARFDEQVNVTWARRLEEAGVHVAYGLVGLKTHAKMAMVVRREHGVLVRYCHIGTGNYNAVTARSFEDLGLFTADPDIGSDVADVFNLLTGSSPASELRRLAVAPLGLRRHLVDQIAAEAAQGPRGRVQCKVNGLTDPEIIEALYSASATGAKVDLLVRSRCSIRAGVPGLSENIRVRSIVGRYLEHSRIYGFGGVDGRPLRVAIGSADLMERNLDRRVEVVVPVTEARNADRLQDILDAAWRDEVSAWDLLPGGAWVRTGSRPGGFSLQRHLRELALERAGLGTAPPPPETTGDLLRPRTAAGPGQVAGKRAPQWWRLRSWLGRRPHR